MRRELTTGFGILLAVLLTYGAAKITLSPGTCRFFQYYQAIQKTEGRISLLERVGYSLILATDPAPKANPAKGSS